MRCSRASGVDYRSGVAPSDSVVPRPALDRRLVDAEFVVRDSADVSRTVLERTGSTNADAAAMLERGEHVPFVVVTDEQVSGRGRLDRVWTAPFGSSLLMSLVLAPTAPAARWGWLPLLTGLAVSDALLEETGLEVALKWPNDLLVVDPSGARKLGGILAERTPSGHAILGVGLNVDQSPDELPGPGGVSLRMAGAPVPRERLLAAVVASLVRRVDAWSLVGGDPDASGLADEYSRRCATLGLEVDVSLPHDGTVRGRAIGVSVDGALVLDTAEGSRIVSAGDIVHVRPTR